MWLKVEGFKDLIRSWWWGIEVRGSASFRLAAKMKEIKQKLKVWNREVFGRLDLPCIQETKIQPISEGLVRSLGYGRFLDWKALDAERVVGGILICWDKKYLAILDWEEGHFTLSCRFGNV